MLSRYLPLLLSLICCACLSGSTPDYEARSFTAASGEKLPYRFLRPLPKYQQQRLPLVIALHGAGERGNDNTQQVGNGLRLFASAGAMEKYPCYVIVPQCPKGKRWVEVNWSLPAHRMPDTPSTPLRLTLSLVDEIIRNYPIDTQRIYVTGLSMGGYGTWDLISRQPGRFAAAVPVCGGGDESKAALLIHTPVWAFHGARDRLVPVARSRNMIAAIRAAGGQPLYTEYPSVGHNAWDSAYSHTPNLLPWLFSQTRSGQ